MRETVLINNNYITVQDVELLGNHCSVQLVWRSQIRDNGTFMNVRLEFLMEKS